MGTWFFAAAGMLPDTALGSPGWRHSSIRQSPSPQRALWHLQSTCYKRSFCPLKAAFPPDAWSAAPEGKTPISDPGTQQQKRGTITRESAWLFWELFPVCQCSLCICSNQTPLVGCLYPMWVLCEGEKRWVITVFPDVKEFPPIAWSPNNHLVTQNPTTALCTTI